jgi:GT2 family glycosyltransferase
METLKMEHIAILIPSYDRPEILEITLPSWLKVKNVNRIFLVAEASSNDMLERYRSVLEKFSSCNIVYKLTLGRLGSVKARNILLEMAKQHDCDYVVMADDDYLLLDDTYLKFVPMVFNLNSKVGMIGGKVIAKKRKTDPDFFLNLPLNLADFLTKFTSYVFLDVKHGPRYAEFLPPFFAIRIKNLDKDVHYDRLLEAPTGFREESDLQQQLKYSGYKLLFDPRICVLHLAVEKGGDRLQMSMSKRIYWKARNHTIFILKWNSSFIKRVWYLMTASLLLLIYRPWYIIQVFRGLSDGIHFFKNTVSVE